MQLFIPRQWTSLFGVIALGFVSKACGIPTNSQKAGAGCVGRNTTGHNSTINGASKKDAEPRPLAEPPRRGSTKQHKADAPLRERGPSTAFVRQEPKGPGSRISAKQFWRLRAYELSSRLIEPVDCQIVLQMFVVSEQGCSYKIAAVNLAAHSFRRVMAAKISGNGTAAPASTPSGQAA